VSRPVVRYVCVFTRRWVVVRDILGTGDETYAVIPDRDVIQLPFEPDLKVVVLADLSVEEAEYCIGLSFRYACYMPRGTWFLVWDKGMDVRERKSRVCW
jgi:hypothetical protein